MNPRNLASGIAEWLAYREHLLAEFPDLDPQTLTDTIDGETALMDLVARLLSDAREAEAYAGALRGMVTQTNERKERLLTRAERLQDAAQRVLEAIGERRVERPEFTAYFAASPSKVIVTDASAIPADLLRPAEPDKTAIKARLKAGEAVPGAVLSNGGQHLTVRWS